MRTGQETFEGMLKSALGWYDEEWLVVGVDDTRVKKTGLKIAGVHYGRDPLGPKFRMNLHWGLRYLHAAVMVPLYRKARV